MAKDYGGLVFYRTKEGKLRYFDPNKAKTPEGKAKIKAIRSGKSKNAFIGSKDTIKSEKQKQANVERAKAEENARNAYKKYSKAVTKADAEREDIIAAKKQKSVADNKARQALNEQRRLNDPIDYGRNERDKLNIQRAQKKIDEQKKPAWVENPNFNYKKYGKYFDENGVLKKETADEYMNAYAQVRRSADGMREKEASDKAKKESFKKATEARKANMSNKDKWNQAKKELEAAKLEHKAAPDKETKARLAKAEKDYEEALKAYTNERWENNDTRLKDDFAKAREGSKKAYDPDDDVARQARVDKLLSDAMNETEKSKEFKEGRIRNTGDLKNQKREKANTDEENFIQETAKNARSYSNGDLQGIVEAYSASKYGTSMEPQALLERTKYEDKLIKEIRSRAKSFKKTKAKKNAWKD